MTSDRAVYSASAELRATFGWTLDHHIIVTNVTVRYCNNLSNNFPTILQAFLGDVKGYLICKNIKIADQIFAPFGRMG